MSRWRRKVCHVFQLKLCVSGNEAQDVGTADHWLCFIFNRVMGCAGIGTKFSSFYPSLPSSSTATLYSRCGAFV